MNMQVRIALLFLCGSLLFSCGSPEKKNSNREASGDVFYHGVFRLNEVEDFRNLYPLNVTEATSFRLGSQIYEGLVKLSQKDLSVIPCLAEKWEMNDSATSFTFHIRHGVKFQNDPCFPGGNG